MKEKADIEELIFNINKDLEELNIMLLNIEDNKKKDYIKYDFKTLTQEMIDNFIDKMYIYNKENIEIFKR